ncbi:hypothetical protein MKZ38_002324 [Zalerion maritima]|uniref:Extracellular membrane protein CFEM domain-containing protein n=1 Tax=Zalerion maritima TaxID=339359 RepID=A0AAD5RX67_9PEZI|nr:hypothetical protein MKZ38_002324 [Zalerion maritima]
MTPNTRAPLLALTFLLARLVTAETSFWGVFPDPECDACLDGTVTICGGESDPDFAFCMCNGNGQGWTDAMACRNLCNSNDLIWGTSGGAMDYQWLAYCLANYESECYSEAYMLQPGGYCDADLETLTGDTSDGDSGNNDDDSSSSPGSNPGSGSGRLMAPILLGTIPGLMMVGTWL